MSEEKMETVKSRFIVGNLLIIAWIFIASAACWLVNPLIGWLFLGFSAFSIYIIVRRFMCNSCYYCKSCTKGPAKLSILFLGANKIPGISNGAIMGMTVFAYTVLTIVPATLLINSLLTSFETLKIISLVSLFGISAVTLSARIINHNKALWKR
jgi:hypothetical protein